MSPSERRYFLCNKLYRIPHLRLDYDVDVKPISAEMDQIEGFHTWNGYNYKYPDRRAMNYLNLGVVGLIDYYDDPTVAGEHPIYLSSARPELIKKKIPEPTDLGKRMPMALKAIYDLVDEPSRCVISWLQDGNEVPWHCHEKPVHGWPRHMYAIHIPIWSKDGIQNGVRDVRTKGEEYFQHYGEGECWLLNTFHDHTAVNKSGGSRFHLWIITPLFNDLGKPCNDRLIEVLERSVESYDGPLMEPARRGEDI